MGMRHSYVKEAKVSDETVRQLTMLKVDISLIFSVIYTQLNAHDQALRWAKDALVSMLRKCQLPSEVRIPHPRAISALCTFDRKKVLKLIVTYR